MRLNLSAIIEIPGGSVPFDTELDTEGLDFPAIRAYLSRPHAVGRVVNEAGVLRLEGELTAKMLCVCDPRRGRADSEAAVRLRPLRRRI